MTTAYAFLTVQPSKTIISFAERLHETYNMDMFIFVEDADILLQESDNVSFVRAANWKEALKYFASLPDKAYDFVWLISQDVFVSSEKALKNINAAYDDYDLLIPQDDCLLNPPACRISNRLLHLVYSNNYICSSYPETIRSIATENNMSVQYPVELSTIKYRARWTLNDIKKKKDHLYYPIKNYEEHDIYRYYDPDRLYLLY